MANSYGFLLVCIMCTFAYFWLFYYWKRRHLYKDINRVHGPYALPLLGSFHLFLRSKSNAEHIEVIDRLMLKYPPPMKIRMGLHLYYFTDDPEELQIILRHPAANQKIVHLYRIFEKLLGRGIFTSSGKTWKNNRRLIEPIFNQTLLNNFVTSMSEKGTELVSNFKRRAGKGFFNIHPLVVDCFLGTIFEFVLGISKKDISLDWNAIVARYSEIAYTKLFRLDGRLDVTYKWTALAREEEELVRKGHEFIDEQIKKRIQSRVLSESGQNKTETVENVGKNTQNYVILIDLLLKKGNLTLEQIRSEIVTFISGGYDTTTFVASVTFIMLGMFPEVEEIVEVIPSDRNIEHSDLSKLKYLNMVIKETMRLFPVTPLIGRFLQDVVKLKTRTLPKGINVVVPLMHLQRNEKFWPDPLKFKPERFTPEECSKRHPYTWLPFSAGPRNCIGMRLALVQMKIAIATTIRECVIKTEYNSIEEIFLAPNSINTLINGYNCSTELRTK